MERRLAAILAADVVGYSRLIGADEAGTLAALRALRKDLVEPTLKRHHGRVVKLMGDGLLAEFASIVDAVAAAVEIQEAMPERSAQLPEDRRIAMRIGVNVGDVVVEDGDLFGDGVNIAARLQEIADPDGVAISEGAHRELRGKLNLPFRDAGEKVLKNIAEPVRTWLWSSVNTPAGSSEPDIPPLALPDKPSIAVLPFDNMSGDPDQEYFADGITEDLITALSRIRWFFVIARNSTFAYKGQSVDVREIARELGVQYLLEGSVRKIGSRVRLTAQLIDGRTGNHVWATRFDRDLEDIFELQDELTCTVVGAIEPELSKAEQERAKLKKPDTLDIWDVYQRGMAALNALTDKSLHEAERTFSRVIELDPGFSAAYSGLAIVHYYYGVLGFAEDSDASRNAGLIAAQRAVQLDIEDAEAHCALGRAHLINHRFDDAISEFQDAIEINPSFAIAHYGIGATFVFSGRSEAGLSYLEQAIRFSPRDAHMGSFLVRVAHAHLNLQDYQNAVEWARKALRLPNFQWSRHAIFASALGHLKRGAEAQPVIDELLVQVPNFSQGWMLDHGPMVDNDDFQHWVEGLRKTRLLE